MGRKRQSALIALIAGIVFSIAASTPALANTIVRFHTVLGNMDVELFDNDAPLTVANFLGYVTDSSDPYNNTLFHRSIPGFVLQGGGFTTDGTSLNVSSVPNLNGTVPNEASLSRSNVRGTIAMAQSGTDPDSATNQWFFNLVDNDGSGPNNLDTLNGGFTVFGQVADQASLAIMDALAALPRVNANPVPPPGSTLTREQNGPFGTLPVNNYDPGIGLQGENLVFISDITIVHTPEPASFFILTTLWVGAISRRRPQTA